MVNVQDIYQFAFIISLGHLSSTHIVRAVLGDSGPNVVLFQTCCVLFWVLEQPWVDTSSTGPHWEQLTQLA
jgi:hypothetical protein